jgi:hypothetical protein
MNRPISQSNSGSSRVISRTDLQGLAAKRMEEAACLFQNKFYDGAYYLSGYAVEAALKARICRLLNCDFPPLPKVETVARAYKIHNLETLFALGGLEEPLNQEFNAIQLKINWSIIIKWDEGFRYRAIGTNSEVSVKEHLEAIDDPNDGILTWLKTQW